MLILIISPLFLSAQTIFFEPQNINVNTNTQFGLPIKISAVNNLFGVVFDLDFDSNLLDYVSTQEGNFLNQGCSTSLMTNNSTPGKLIFGLTRLGVGCGGVSGSGLIATINFRSKSQNGIANLSFSNNSLCILVGSSCNYITGTWNPATVTIGTPDTTPPVVSITSPIPTGPFNTCTSTVSTSTAVNGAGWVLIKFSDALNDFPFTTLPMDPINNGNYYYAYAGRADNNTFELDAVLESIKYHALMSTDGGDRPGLYETGNALNL